MTPWIVKKQALLMARSALIAVSVLSGAPAGAKDLAIAMLGFETGLSMSPSNPDYTLYSPPGLRNPDGSMDVILDFENHFHDYFFASMSVYIDGTLVRVRRLDNAPPRETLTLRVAPNDGSEISQIRLVLKSQYHEHACFDERIGPGLIRLLPSTRFHAPKAAPSLQLAWMSLGKTPTIGIHETPTDEAIAAAAVVADALRDENRVPIVRAGAAGEAADILIGAVGSGGNTSDGISLTDTGQIAITAPTKPILDAVEFGFLRNTAATGLSATGLTAQEHRAISATGPVRGYVHKTGEVVRRFKLAEFEQGQVPAQFVGALSLPVEAEGEASQLYVYLNDHLVHSEPVTATGAPVPIEVRLDQALLELDNTMRVSILRTEDTEHCNDLPAPAPFELLPGSGFVTRTVSGAARDFVEMSTQIGDDLTILVDQNAQISSAKLAELAGVLSYHYRALGDRLDVRTVVDTSSLDLPDSAIVIGADDQAAVTARLEGQTVRIQPNGPAGTVHVVSDNGVQTLRVDSLGAGAIPSPKRLFLSKGDLAVFDGDQTRYELSQDQSDPKIITAAQASEHHKLSGVLTFRNAQIAFLFLVAALWGTLTLLRRGR